MESSQSAFVAHALPSAYRPVSSKLCGRTHVSMQVEALPRISRRGFARLLATASLFPILPALSADVTSQLMPYKDLPKGFSILRPSGWNEFEGMQDNYDIKWQDVIQPLEFVTVLTAPLAKGKTLRDIGAVDAVGSKIAKVRGGELVSAVEKDIDGTPAYVLEIKRKSSHQLTLLTVSKLKLYSVNASSSEKRWSRRKELLSAVVNSFQPKI